MITNYCVRQIDSKSVIFNNNSYSLMNQQLLTNKNPVCSLIFLEPDEATPHPYATHAQPISFFSILSPAQYWVRGTDHLAPRYAVSSIPNYLVPPRSKYSPQHPV